MKNGTMRSFAVSIQRLRKAAVMGITAAALSMAASAARADMITNGSFATTGGASGQIGYNGLVLTGWTNANGSAATGGGTGYNFVFNSGTQADTTGVTSQYGSLQLWGPSNGSNNGLPASSPNGHNFVALDGDFHTGAISQTITGLTVGDTYDVSFYWAASQQEGFNGATVQYLDVSLGSQTLDTTAYDLPSHGFSGWMPVTDVFTANSTSEALSFLAVGNTPVPPFLLLDGVTMTPTPEPATLPLLVTGLIGGLGILKSMKWLRR